MANEGAQRPRILLIGYGVRGRQWHDNCRRYRRFALAGAVDPDPQARNDAGAGGLAAWASLDEALAATRVDGAIACLRAGAGVLVEKPLALSVADAGHIATAARETGRPALVGQNFRFLSRERVVRSVLKSGDIGDPVECVIASARPPTAAASHVREIKLAPLWDIGLHHLDALRIRFGSLPERVEAEANRNEGAIAVVLDWSGGPRVVYQHSETAPLFHYLELVEGTTGTLTIRDEDVTLWLRRRKPRRVRVSRGPTREHVLLDAFLGALRGEPAPELSAEDNLQTIAVIEAAARSIELGRGVLLSEVVRA